MGKLARVLLGMLTLSQTLTAATNFDRTSWTDGPITLAVDFSGVSATNGSTDATTLARAVGAAAARWNAVLRVPQFQIEPDSRSSQGPNDHRNEFYFSTTISPT